MPPSGFRSSLEIAVSALPVVLVYGVCALGVRWRSHGRQTASWRTARDVCLLLALVGVGVFTLLPGPTGDPLAVELVPLRTVWLNLQGDPGYGAMVLAANAALFIPAGFALYWVFARVGRAIIAAALLSVLIEALQWTVVGGRVIATDDVLMNTLGGAIGSFAASKSLPTGLQRLERADDAVNGSRG